MKKILSKLNYLIFSTMLGKRTLVLLALAGIVSLPLLLRGSGAATSVAEDTVRTDSLAASSPDSSRRADGEEPFYEYGAIALYLANKGLDGEWGDNGDMNRNVVIRYVGGLSKDTAFINGPYNEIYGQGERCRIVTGVDTLDFDITDSLPEEIDIMGSDAPEGCRKALLKKTYGMAAIDVNLLLPENLPAALRRKISGMLWEDFASKFSENSHKPFRSRAFSFVGANSADKMLAYYYKHFIRAYEDNFLSEPGEEMRYNFGSVFELDRYIYPVWTSDDGSQTTYRFFVYTYSGGAHGGCRDFYQTYDNRSGRVLGWKDFYTEEECRRVIDRLGKELYLFQCESRGEKPDSEGRMDPSLEESEVVGEGYGMYEKVEGKLYPTPARTKEGIVFTYQTYQKGSGADGTIHLLVKQ